MEINYEDINTNNLIIDIRPKIDYLNFHIKNSVNIPRVLLLNNPSEYLNKYETYYLLCDKGTISKKTANILNSLGYNCYSIIGGLESINKYY